MANPFLVLGGVAVGVITAGIGVLAVPGWVDAANDSAAINDLGNIRGAESAAVLQIGEYTDDFGMLGSGELGVKFQKSEGVTMIGLKAESNEAWCASVKSKSGKFFAASNVQARIATGPGAESAMTTAGCTPGSIQTILDEAANHVPPIDAGLPGTGGGSWVGEGSSGGSNGGNNGGGSANPVNDGNPDIVFSLRCDTADSIVPPLAGANGTVTWTTGGSAVAQATPDAGTGLLPAQPLEAGVTYVMSFDGTARSIESWRQGIDCFRSLDLWTDESDLDNINNAFLGMTNLVSVPTNLPSTIWSADSAFEGATSFNDANISSWNVENLRQTRAMFRGATSFQQDLTGWTFGHGLAASWMFAQTSYSGDLSHWTINDQNDSIVDLYAMLGETTGSTITANDWTINVTGDGLRLDAMMSDAKDLTLTANNWDIRNAQYAQVVGLLGERNIGGRVTTNNWKFQNTGDVWLGTFSGPDSVVNWTARNWVFENSGDVIDLPGAGLFVSGATVTGDISGWKFNNTGSSAGISPGAGAGGVNMSGWNN